MVDGYPAMFPIVSGVIPNSFFLQIEIVNLPTPHGRNKFSSICNDMDTIHFVLFH
jgi:hypothetical protein